MTEFIKVSQKYLTWFRGKMVAYLNKLKSVSVTFNSNKSLTSKTAE